MAEAVTEHIDIAAPPQLIYDLVADVARMGEWSPEATGARGTATGPLTVGDRFIGTNRRGPFWWFTQCRVTRAERGSEFGFDVDFGPFPVSSWRYQFTPVASGTRVTETWLDRRAGVRGLAMKAVGQVIIPGDRPAHNRANMVATLRQLKNAAERQTPTNT